MKRLVFQSLLFLCLLTAATNQAQDADQIVRQFIEKTGGIANWKSLAGIKMELTAYNQDYEIPLTIIQLKDGRQATFIDVDGVIYKQGVFDGKTLWSFNFNTLRPEKSDRETLENYLLDINDMPSVNVHSLVDYKDKGYEISYVGLENVDGSDYHKLKIKKEAITINKRKQESLFYYFFDKESLLLSIIETTFSTGPSKGATSKTVLEDYKEVGGLMFPFKLTQGIKGTTGSVVTIESIELDPLVRDEDFAFPK